MTETEYYLEEQQPGQRKMRTMWDTPMDGIRFHMIPLTPLKEA
jgi:hypothetical protein